MQGQYVALACSRHGSRVLDAIWSGAALGARKEIAAELGEYQHRSLTFPNVPFPPSWVAGNGPKLSRDFSSKGWSWPRVLGSLFSPAPLRTVQPCAPTPPPDFSSLNSEVLTLS